MPRLLILVAAFLGFAASAAPLDLTTPEGQIAALRRIQCSDVDGKPVTFYFKGVAYSRVPGEPDRLHGRRRTVGHGSRPRANR